MVEEERALVEEERAMAKRASVEDERAMAKRAVVEDKRVMVKRVVVEATTDVVLFRVQGLGIRGLGFGV